MLVCPRCHLLYEDPRLTRCPADGGLLEAPSDPRVGTVLDKYRILGRIGTGGMGTVYRAEHLLIGRSVAIKILRPEFKTHHQLVRRFLLEARAASMIQHPNIVDILDFGVTPDGSSYCVMEYLEGQSLAELLDREGPPPLYRTVNILVQVTYALSAAHGQGIVHRDLKPDNVFLLERQGRRALVALPAEAGAPVLVEREASYDHVKLLDFGVAQIQELTAALDSETRSQGIVFGSPDYISPEQAQGLAVDLRTDIYALGAIFYEMLTGEPPFFGETAEEVMAHHVKTPPVPPSRRRPDLDIPPEADALALAALAKDPAARPQSADEFRERLKACVGRVAYRRDLRKALDRYQAELANQPIRVQADDEEERRRIHEEIRSFFASEEPDLVDPDSLQGIEGSESDDAGVEELRRLLREEEPE